MHSSSALCCRRCEEEDVEVTDDAKALLTKIAQETSLRYAIHLITASALICQKRKAAEVEIEDVGRAYTLFVDVKRSMQFLIEYQDQYMFNEVPDLPVEQAEGEQMQA